MLEKDERKQATLMSNSLKEAMRLADEQGAPDIAQAVLKAYLEAMRFLALMNKGDD